MTFNFPTPLRLSVGSHEAGSGKGCAMNVISWENGDTTITDFPECADRFLSRIVQHINDQICTHTKNTSLCPDCSVKVLAIAHRTVGTSLCATHSHKECAEIYAKIARTEVFYAADAYDAARDAYDAARAAADVAYATYDYDAARAAARAYDAARAAACAADADFLIAQGHRIIDQFEAFSGIKAQPVNSATVIKAVEQMAMVR